MQQLEDRLAAEQASSEARASDHTHQVGMLRQQLQGQQGQLERQAREVQQLQAALAAAQSDTQAEASGITARLATAQVRPGATNLSCLLPCQLHRAEPLGISAYTWLLRWGLR